MKGCSPAGQPKERGEPPKALSKISSSPAATEPNIEEIETTLRETFKLSSYEAKAYLSLLKFGKQSPKQISSNALVPLPRVYDTLETLMQKGFVLKQGDDFSPIPARRAIRGRSTQFKLDFSREQSERETAEGRIVEALENLPSSPSQRKKSEQKENEISILKGFNSIANKFSELLEESHDIILVAKRAVEAKEIFIPILLELASKKKEDRKRLRIIVPKHTKITKAEAHSAKKAFAEIRKSDHVLFDMMITDLDDVIIGVPDPLSNEINHAVAIWVRNASFASSTKESVDEIWKSSQRVP